MIVENTATQRVHTSSCCTSIWPRFRADSTFAYTWCHVNIRQKWTRHKISWFYIIFFLVLCYRLNDYILSFSVQSTLNCWYTLYIIIHNLSSPSCTIVKNVVCTVVINAVISRYWSPRFAVANMGLQNRSRKVIKDEYRNVRNCFHIKSIERSKFFLLRLTRQRVC